MEHREETTTLISADKVSGTNVYNTVGDSLGEVHDVAGRQGSGHITYAVMSFGASRHRPEVSSASWSVLTYDSEKGGYVVDLSRERLKGAPVVADEAQPKWTREYEQEIHEHYLCRAL